MKRSDLDVMKADNGGTTFILDVIHYISKPDKRIQNNSFYQKLNEDPTELTKDKVGTPPFYVKFINLIYPEGL